jgi:hypothetical protein
MGAGESFVYILGASKNTPYLIYPCDEIFKSTVVLHAMIGTCIKVFRIHGSIIILQGVAEAIVFLRTGLVSELGDAQALIVDGNVFVIRTNGFSTHRS